MGVFSHWLPVVHPRRSGASPWATHVMLLGRESPMDGPRGYDTGSWVTYTSPVTWWCWPTDHACVAHNFVVITHGRDMCRPWLIHWSPMSSPCVTTWVEVCDSTWAAHGTPMARPGWSMGHPRVTHNSRMGRPWANMSRPRTTHEAPVGNLMSCT